MTDNFDLEDISNRTIKILEDLGLRLYDISYNQVSGTLRVFIDRERGAITVKDCRGVSNLISKELENSDSFNFRYTLEVSSPGIQRPLKRPEHYVWALGRVVEIDMGDKKIRGYLRNAHKDGVVVGTKSGENIIPYASIIKAKVVEEIVYDKRR